MIEHLEVDPRPQILSLQIDAELAAEIDWIASQDGVSRSEILRRLLLSSLHRESRGVAHSLHELQTIRGRLGQIQAKLEDLEADDAAQAIKDARDAIEVAVDDLEDFEPDDE